jgi:hypothetical protein
MVERRLTLLSLVVLLLGFPGWAADNESRGRVLYNGLGHWREVGNGRRFRRCGKDMVRWSMGDLKRDSTPRRMPGQQPSAERFPILP